MTKAGKISIAAVFAATLATASVAEDSSPRFESSGFLQSLDTFIAEQMNKQKASEADAKLGTVSELELSLRSAPEAGDDFFKLRDSAPVDNTSFSTSLSELPDFSSLLAPTGEMRGSAAQDLYSANSRVDVSFGKAKPEEGKGFKLSLKSAYRLSADGLPAPTAFVSSDIANREFNLGFAASYSGFGVDATLSHQTSIFANELTSFDVGLSYQASRWAARLSLSEYTEGADLYGIENEARNMISVELGASFRLSQTVGLTGGVRYYDYGDRWLLNPETGENSQMIFLGGRLKF